MIFWSSQLAQTPPPVYHRATHRLPPNHLIRQDDIRIEPDGQPPIDSVVGRYVAAQIDSGKPVLPEGLRPTPSLAVAPGQRLMATHIASLPLRMTLNVGSTVSLCDDRGCFLEDVRVAAVQCTDAKSTDCSAMLEIPRTLDKATWQRLGRASNDPLFQLYLVSPSSQQRAQPHAGP